MTDDRSGAAPQDFRPIDDHRDIYRQMFQHSIVATLIHDLEMKILEVNESASRLFGYEQDELLEKSIYDLHTQSELGHSREVLSEMDHEEKLSVRTSFKRKDGSVFYAAAWPTKFLLGDRPVIHVFIQDITLQVEREEKARQYTEELEQFAFMASHDLREPLRTICSYVELLDGQYGDQLGDRGARYMRFISSGSARLRKLVEGLLDYSRLGEREPLSEIDCSRVVSDVLEDLGEVISKKEATIRVGNLPTIVGYESKLRVLIRNLLTNALRFSKSGVAPKIEIHVGEFERYWELSVADEGVGIEPALREKIFLMFRRGSPGNTSGDESEAIGIGLAACRKIARMHGGEVRVESRPGEGSTFHVTLSKRLH